jgi:hypothetical protein
MPCLSRDSYDVCIDGDDFSALFSLLEHSRNSFADLILTILYRWYAGSYYPIALLLWRTKN